MATARKKPATRHIVSGDSGSGGDSTGADAPPEPADDPRRAKGNGPMFDGSPAPKE